MYDLSSIVEKYPKLTCAEEKELLSGYGKDPRGVREKLFLHNIMLVPFVVNKMWWIRNENMRDECISYGIEGLRRAADGFDPKTGYRFCSYAVTTIRRHIIRETTPTKIDLACYHIDAPLASNGNAADDDGGRTLEQIIHKDINPESFVLKETTQYVENDSRRDCFNGLLRALLHGCKSKTERKYLDCTIEYYCGSNPNGSRLTLAGIAKRYGVTRERVRQMVNKGVRIMRTRLFKTGFAPVGPDNVNGRPKYNPKGFGFAEILNEIGN